MRNSNLYLDSITNSLRIFQDIAEKYENNNIETKLEKTTLEIYFSLNLMSKTRTIYKPPMEGI